MVNLSVILPAYREKESLEVLLPRIKSVLEDMGLAFQILVVDTQIPMDTTGELCRQINVDYINREDKNTYGAAIRTGIKHSQGNKIIIMDADGSHKPEDIKELYKWSRDFDLVIGSRYIKYGKTENNFILILMSLMVNIAYRFFLNIKVKDVSNSFRLYDTKKLSSLVLECENFDLVEEILIKLTLEYPNLKIKEIPIVFKKRTHGESKRDLIKFIFSYLTTMHRLIRIKNSYKKFRGME